MNYLRLRGLLFRMDPEAAHRLTLTLLRLAGSLPPLRFALRRAFRTPTPPQAIEAFGLRFPNRVGLAAGYDKDGDALAGLACLGFGHIEVGTVTPAPQAGQPRPRVFRLEEEEALINRMGFPNGGSEALARRLRRRMPGGVRLGVNLGKGAATPLEDAAQDYGELVRMFHPLADYLVLNLSSPNTPGLRRLQDGPVLSRLLDELAALRRELEAHSPRRVPLLVKLAPDLPDAALQSALEAIVRAGLDGVIATNTTLNRNGLSSEHAREAGGLSGGPLRTRSTEMVRSICEMGGKRLPVIGVGGVLDVESAQEKLDAGASLVQVFTGLVYRGPGLVRAILMGLRDRVADPGLAKTAAPLGGGAG